MITPISIAFYHGHYKIIRFLIKNNVKMYRNDENLFYVLIKLKNLEQDLTPLENIGNTKNKINCQKFLIFNY